LDNSLQKCLKLRRRDKYLYLLEPQINDLNG